MNGGINPYSYVKSPLRFIDALGLTPDIPPQDSDVETPRGTEEYNRRMQKIEQAINMHDYKDISHAGATPKIPGGVSGAIAHTKATGELVGGSTHVIKGQELKSILERALAGLDNARSMTACQKALLRARAQPYLDKLNEALTK